MADKTYKQMLDEQNKREEGKLTAEEIESRIDSAKNSSIKNIVCLKENLTEKRKALKENYKQEILNFSTIRTINREITGIETDIEEQKELHKLLFKEEASI